MRMAVHILISLTSIISLATADGPDQFKVSGVKENDVLNLRESHFDGPPTPERLAEITGLTMEEKNGSSRFMVECSESMLG